MKKIVIMLALAITSMGAFAQTKQGDSSFGLNIGGGFEDYANHAVLGLDYRYNFTDAVRFAPSISYFVKNKGLSAIAFDVNAHYVFPLAEYIGFYPLAGINLSFWKHHLGGLNKNNTRFGANIGLGAELYASKEITIGFEFKYLLIKDYDQPMVGLRIGYNF